MLSAMSNPYSPGAGSPPPALVGRDVELHNFEVAAQRLLRGRSDRSQMLIGLRGVGKTVLLREFTRLATRHGWTCQHLECVEGTDLAHSVARLVRTAILELSAGGRLAGLGSPALGVLRSFQLTWKIPGGGSVVLGGDAAPVPGRADSGGTHDAAGLNIEGLADQAGPVLRPRTRRDRLHRADVRRLRTPPHQLRACVAEDLAGARVTPTRWWRGAWR